PEVFVKRGVGGAVPPRVVDEAAQLEAAAALDESGNHPADLPGLTRGPGAERAAGSPVGPAELGDPEAGAAVVRAVEDRAKATHLANHVGRVLAVRVDRERVEAAAAARVQER